MLLRFHRRMHNCVRGKRECHQLLKTQTHVFFRAASVFCALKSAHSKRKTYAFSATKHNRLQYPAAILPALSRKHMSRSERGGDMCHVRGLSTRWRTRVRPPLRSNASTRASISGEINNEDQPLNNHYISQVSGRKRSLEQTLWLSN